MASGSTAVLLARLVGVADRAVEYVAEPPVEPHVHTSNVPEIGVRHPHDGALLLPHRIIDQKGPCRGEREVVVVVDRHVEHHIVTERVASPELEADRLPEIQVGTEPANVHAVQDQREVWGLTWWA